MKTYSFEEIKDEYIGKLGTPKRDAYENELRLEILGQNVKENRKKRKLTKEELGKLV